ncbi:MAG: asparagine synthase-related protein [Pseudomonadota bacterium]
MATLLAGILPLNGRTDCQSILDKMGYAMVPGGYRQFGAEFGPVAVREFVCKTSDTLHQFGDTLFAGDLDAAYFRDDPLGKAIDPTVVSESFGRSPLNAVQRIDGEFSFVHWNSANETLSLVRDRFGCRPLFYIHKPDAFFAFASLITGLVISDLTDGEIDHGTVAKASVTNQAVGEDTIYRDIKRAPRAQIMQVRRGRIHEQEYWALDASNPISHREPPDDVFSEVRSLLKNAVERAIPSNGPVVTHCSGGLDSTSVAAMAAHVVGPSRRVRGYSFAYEDDRIPDDIRVEHHAAAWVASEIDNIDLVGISGTSAIPRITGSIDATTGLASDPDEIYRVLLRSARADGATRVLSGWGGDESSSYFIGGALAHLALAGRLRTALTLAKMRSNQRGRSPLRQVIGELRAFMFGGRFSVHGPRLLTRPVATLAKQAETLKPEFRQGVMAADPPVRPDVHYMRVQLLASPHLTLMQEQIQSHAAEFGISYVSPLLNRSLIEFIVRLPPEFVVWDGNYRAPLREAMAGLMPDKARLSPDKYAWYLGATLDFTENRDLLIESMQSLRGSAAEIVFEIDALIARLQQLPTTKQMNDVLQSQRGERFRMRMPGHPHVVGMQYAHFLAKRQKTPLI